MNCPQYQSKNTIKRKKKTVLGYLQSHCRDCCKQFNERSGTKFNFIEYPTKVVRMAVHYYYRFKVSLDDVAELMMMRNKEAALYPAIKNVFDDKTKHRDSKHMNNRIEQNHRGIKLRYKVMKGFKCPFCALIFCTAFEEIHQLFRMKNKTRSERRKSIVSKIENFNELFLIAA